MFTQREDRYNIFLGRTYNLFFINAKQIQTQMTLISPFIVNYS